MNIDHGPVNVSGNTAWQEGVFRVTDATGATMDTGEYFSVLEKRDGKWRLLRDIYNSDGAPAAAALGQDAVAVDPARCMVEFENDKVRMLRIAGVRVRTGSRQVAAQREKRRQALLSI